MAAHDCRWTCRCRPSPTVARSSTSTSVTPSSTRARAVLTVRPRRHRSPRRPPTGRPHGGQVGQPGIQPVPASGTRAMAAASTVRATRSSGSRWCTPDLPHARARAVTSMVMARR